MGKKIKKSTSITILFLEDSPRDFEIVQELLIGADFDLHMERVQTKRDFISSLQHQQFDIILADFKLPGFDAFAALQIVMDRCPDIPFICVSGSIGEETAIKLIKLGAVDYVLKDRLERLPTAIKHALDVVKKNRARRQAEEELNESEQRFHRLFEASPDALMLLDPSDSSVDWPIIDCNDIACTMNGYTRDELIGKSIDILNTAKGTPEERGQYLEYIKREGIVHYETFHRHHDGHMFPIEVSTSIITFKGRELILGIDRDITHRKQAEKELQWKTAFLEAQTNSSIDGILVVDDQGKKIFQNQRCIDLWKIPQNIVEQNDDKVQVEYVMNRTKYPEQFVERVVHLYSHPQEISHDVVEFKDGMFLDRYSAPVLGQDGTNYGRVWTFRDITDRMRIEDELRTLSVRQEAILSAVPDIIMEVDNNKIYTWGNKAGIEFFGNDVIGTEASYYFEGDQVTYNYVQPIFEGREDTIYIESWQRRKDGAKRLLAWWCRVLKDSRGNVTGALSSARDITERKQIEETLRKSEYFFKESQRAGLIGSYHTDFIAGSWESSEVLDSIFGIDRSYNRSVQGWLDLIHPDDREGMNRYLMQEVIAQRKPFDKEYRVIRHSDHVTRYVHGLGNIDFDNAGTIISMIGTIQDITERKEAEKALLESMERYRNLTNISPVGIFHTDEKGLTTYVNPKWCQITGLTFDAALGQGWLNAIHPDDKDKLFNGWQQAISLHKTSITDYRIVRPDGTAAWVMGQAIPEINSENQVVGYIGTVTDITERKLAEEALRKSEATLSDAMKIASLGTWEYDVARDQFTFNDQFYALFHTTAEREGGYIMSSMQYAQNFVHPDDMPMVGEEIQKALETDDPNYYSRLDHRIHYSDGPIGYISVHIRVEKDAKGSTVKTHGVNQDITERKRAEEALKKSEEKLKELFETAPVGYHELDAQGNIRAVNQTELKMLGFSYEEMIGWPAWEFISDREEAKKRVLDKLAGKLQPNKNSERIVVRRDGSTFPAIIDDVILRNEQGAITGIRTTMVDITERKRAEEAVIYERNLLKSLMDNIPDSIYFKDINSRFIQVSKAQAIRFGINDPAELVGKTDFDIFTEEHARPAYENEQEIIKTGQPLINLEEKETWADDKEAWVLTTKLPLRDPDGQIIGTFGISRDITNRKRTEEELRESEERFRRLFAASPDSVMLFDPSSTDVLWKIVDCNEVACTMNGYSREELLGKSVDILNAEIETLEGHEGHIEHIRREGVLHFETRHRHRDGRVFHIEVSTSLVTLQGRELVLGIDRDITERKRATLEILKLNRTYAVLSNINQLIVRERYKQKLLEGACTIAVEDGKFLMCWIGMVDEQTGNINPVAKSGKTNDYLEQLHVSISDTPSGRSPSGTSCRENTRIVCNNIEHDEMMAGWREQALALGYKSSASFPLHVATKVVGVINFYSSEVNYFDAAEVSLLDELSMDISFALQSIEVEENRNYAEQALSESEARYRRLVEFSPDAIAVHSEGHFVYVNPAAIALLGAHDASQLLGKSFIEVVHPVSRDLVRQRMIDGLMEGKPLPIAEEKFIKMDGSVIDIEVASLPIVYEGKSAIQILARDITEKKRMQGQFMQAQKVQSIGTLAGGIAHDFNNILGIILAYASVLERVSKDQKKFTESIKAINSAVSRGASLVRQILTFARQTDITIRPMSVPELTHEVVIMLQETFPKIIEFKEEFDRGIPLITADHTQIHQALLNLCVNARDAMPKGGVITMRVETCTLEKMVQQFPGATYDRYVCLSVSDTGSGMDEETKSRIFDPFFTTKELGKGTGLGLSVVYGVVQSHYGFITVDSEMGKGTIFHLYLPVPQESKIIHEEQKKESVGSSGGTETILFVEDEELLRTAVQSTLEASGYKVYVAADGREAVEVYRQHQNEITLVLTDMGLPKQTGMDVFQQVKKLNPGIKIILASGFIPVDQKSELLKAGANEFIQKPYELADVLRKIREVLDENGGSNEQHNISH